MYLKFRKICRICLKENKLVPLNTKINEYTSFYNIKLVLLFSINHCNSIITDYSFQRMMGFQNIYVKTVSAEQKSRLILSICVQILIKPYWKYWLMKKY